MIRLKQLREEREESQAYLASVLGVHPSTVGGWELGSRQMDYSTIIKIADYYGVSIDYLFGRERVHHNITEKENDLVRVYRSLSKKGKQLVIDIANTLYTYKL